jgi:16S rRNA (cytosine967-C5)-methyltransferase
LDRLEADASAFPDLVLEDLDDAGLSPRDAALAHAIHDAAIRHWRALVRLLGLHLRRPWGEIEPHVGAALLGGLAQIVYLDRIPVHAAIDESVEWVKARAGKAPAGLVNAVLRRSAELVESKVPAPWDGAPYVLPRGDGTSVRFRRGVLPEDALEALAIATSHPAGLLRRWRAVFRSFDVVRDVALRSLRSPPVILNTAYARGALSELPPDRAAVAAETAADASSGGSAGADIARELDAAAIDEPTGPALRFLPHVRAGSHAAIGSRQGLLALLQSRQDVWVQDPSSSAAIASIADLRPRVVLDLCAGQGTKTRQLAAAFPDARITAADIDADRAATLRAVFRDHPRVRVVDYDQALASHQAADLILLDVPCTNTGVLSRRVEAKHRVGPRQLERLVLIQRQILQTAASRLTAGGSILYATCSLEREENEQAVAWACDSFRLAASRVRADLPDGLLGTGPECATTYSDGAFSALLTRQG